MKRDDPRKLLATPMQRREYPGVRTWMRDHPEAVELVEAWLEMRADGTTDWSLRRLQDELIHEHGFPFASDTPILRWITRTYGLAYAKAQGRG